MSRTPPASQHRQTGPGATDRLAPRGTVSTPLHADGSVSSSRCHRHHRASGGRAAGRADDPHLGLITATPSGYQPGLRVVDRLAAAGVVQRASARIFIPQRFGDQYVGTALSELYVLGQIYATTSYGRSWPYPSRSHLPEAIAWTVCQYTGVSSSLHFLGGTAGRPLAGRPLRIFDTCRRWSGWLSYWLSETVGASSASYRGGSWLISMPRNYGSSTVITRISASSASRLDPAESTFSRYELLRALPVGSGGSRQQTLTTARRHDAIPGRDKHRGGEYRSGWSKRSAYPHGPAFVDEFPAIRPALG